MSILKKLREALTWEDPYEDMPDYLEICDHLNIDPYDDRETVRDAIEEGLALMELEADLSGIDFDAECEPAGEANE